MDNSYKPFQETFIRDLFNSYCAGDILFSRLVEVLNEKAGNPRYQVVVGKLIDEVKSLLLVGSGYFMDDKELVSALKGLMPGGITCGIGVQIDVGSGHRMCIVDLKLEFDRYIASIQLKPNQNWTDIEYRVDWKSK